MSIDASDSSSLTSVIHQSEIVQYHPRSIVSRTLVKNLGGTVTAFAFDQGESLRKHTAPFDTLVFMIEGEAEISISIIAHHVRAGQMLLIPADQPHSIRAITKFKMIVVMIKV